MDNDFITDDELFGDLDASRDRRQEARLAAELVFGEGPPEGSVIMVATSPRGPWRGVHTIDELVEQIVAGTARSIGMATMPSDLENGNRGGNGQAVSLQAFWMDVDCKDRGDYPPREVAAPLLADFPIQPSIVTNTGGGYHVFWALEEPLDLRDAKDRAVAERLSYGLQAYYRAQLRPRGFKLDRTQEMARVLMLAGGFHHKPDYGQDFQIRVVRQLSSFASYNPADLEWVAELGWQQADEDGELPPSGGSSGSSGPRRAGPYNPVVRRAVEALQQSWPIRGEVKDLVLPIFDRCPVCAGRRSKSPGHDLGTAHVQPGRGHLVCKRGNCEASEPGLPFEEWVPLVLPDHAPDLLAEWEAAKSVQLYRPGTTATSRSMSDAGSLRDVFDQALNFIDSPVPGAGSDQEAPPRSRVALLAPTTGSGKTRLIRKLVREGRQVIYAAPNHDLAAEFAEPFSESDFRVWHAKGAPTACRFPDAFRRYGARRDWRYTACEGCKHQVPTKDQCETWKDPGEVDLVVTSHDNLGAVREKLGDEWLVIVDEFPDVLDEEAIPAGDVRRCQVRVPGTPPGVIDALNRQLVDLENRGRAEMARLGTRQRETPIRWLEETLKADTEFGATFRLTLNLVSTLDKPDGEQLRTSSADPATMQHPSTARLWSVLARMTDPSGQVNEASEEVGFAGAITLREGENGIEWVLRRPSGVVMALDRAVILDATGGLNGSLLEALVGRESVGHFGLRVIEPALGHRRFHVKTGSMSKTQLGKEGDPAGRVTAALKNMLRQLPKDVVERLERPDVKIGLITHKSLVEQLERRLPEVLCGRWTVGYYGKDDRGTNRFEGVDALITVGDPYANIGSTSIEAELLDLHPGRRIEEHVQALLVQAHGRARSLRATRPQALIHLGRRLPCEWRDYQYEVIELPMGRPRTAPNERTRALLTARRRNRQPISSITIRQVECHELSAAGGMGETAYSFSPYVASPTMNDRTLRRMVADVAVDPAFGSPYTCFDCVTASGSLTLYAYEADPAAIPHAIEDHGITLREVQPRAAAVAPPLGGGGH
ncbi:hypothetical protein [Engelhardtia mirabilis]|uniref:Uncharacterized protein n=1 Tax=Engelhardtia mirabilis TaxID=2528011 RepID=A0A518BH69_9BACT|nr:hypothetical protein Pla133_13980 [Planctomycetes bacterium Pla133]QDV00654.1 hypothetical protein Pla86_13970 [Planctomycetes bacterium Pla86]